jgi:hypothetical protein
MPRATPLPAFLRTGAFTSAEAAAAGLARSRLRLDDVSHPFRGVHSAEPMRDPLVQRCHAAMRILGGQHVLSHVTAARLWGIPLPWRWRPEEDVHVLAVGARGRLRRPGIRSWETARLAPIPHRLHDLPVAEPAEVWGQLSGMTRPTLPLEWLVAAGDHLVSGTRLPDGARTPPLATVEQLAHAGAQRTGMRGVKLLRAALPLIRAGVDSPQETRLRLALVLAGLPEPVIQPEIPTRAGLRHPDLGYLDERILLEYQGDEHRTDRARWLRDLTRVQEFEDAGYRTIHVGADDLAPAGRPALVDRVRRALLAGHPSARTHSGHQSRAC